MQNTMRLLNLVTEGLERSRESSCSSRDALRQRLLDTDKQIANVRQAILDGLDDVEWANCKLSELTALKQDLESKIEGRTEAGPLEIGVEQIDAYRRNAVRTSSCDDTELKRKLIRNFVTQMHIEPGTREITMRIRRVPAQLYQALVAGAGSVGLVPELDEEDERRAHYAPGAKWCFASPSSTAP